FQVEYDDRPAAVHVGQASSGGGFNDLVLYHGIRNSIWVLVKNLPVLLVVRWMPWLLLLHLETVMRRRVRGKGLVVAKLYLDAGKGFLRMLRKRKVIQQSRRVSIRELRGMMSNRFYEETYVKRSVAELFSRGGA